MDELHEESLVESVSPLSESEKITFRTVLSSRYRIEQELGQGGMSIVYKCTDLAMNRAVAIKCLQPRLAQHPKSIVRMQQEAKAIARLDHRNIVRVHHFDNDDGVPFIVMDYVEGRSLSEIIERGGALEPDRAIGLIEQVMDALSHAHSQGVVHRDLKPSNIIVVGEGSPGESVKLLDFGIARIGGDEQNKLTQTGEVFGSPLYMSPEQCHGLRADPSSDQYACGVMLFECLTGHTPFIGESAMSILLKQISEAPPSLHEGSLGREFDNRLEAVVARMLSKKREDRYPSMSAARSALLETLKAGAISLPPKVVPKKHSTPLVWATVVSVALAIVGIGLWTALSVESPNAVTQPSKPTHTADAPVDGEGDNAVAAYLNAPSYDTNSRGFDTGGNGTGNKGRFSLMTGKSLELIAQRNPKVESINLAPCAELIDEDLHHLERLPRLRVLSLAGASNIGDEGCRILSGFRHLDSLDLSRTHVSRLGLQYLSSLPLTTLLVRQDDLDPGALTEIARITTLEQLDLSGNNRIAAGIRYLRPLPHLRDLNVEFTPVNDADIKEIAKLSHLKTVRIGNTRTTDAGLKYLAALPLLENLKSNKLQVHRAALMNLLSRCPHLTNVNASDVDTLSTSDFDRLQRSFPSLVITKRRPGTETLFRHSHTSWPEPK